MKLSKLFGIGILALTAFMVGNISTMTQAVCSALAIPALIALAMICLNPPQKLTDEFVPPITK